MSTKETTCEELIHERMTSREVSTDSPLYDYAVGIIDGLSE